MEKVTARMLEVIEGGNYSEQAFTLTLAILTKLYSNSESKALKEPCIFLNTDESETAGETTFDAFEIKWKDVACCVCEDRLSVYALYWEQGNKPLLSTQHFSAMQYESNDDLVEDVCIFILMVLS